MLVAEDLDFDMARALDEFLEHDAAIAETGFRFAHSAGEFGLEVCGFRDLTDTPAPAAGDGLDEQRVADPLGGFGQCADILRLAAVTGQHWNARLFGDALGFILRAHRADGSGRRADPGEAGSDYRFCEGRILRQKAVAGMDGVGACL